MYKTLNDIKDFISTNLADAVAIVEAENSITLTPYLVLQIFTPYGKQYPSISITPSVVDPMAESAGNRVYFGNPTHRDDVINIHIWDRRNPNDARTLETNIVGYMDALEELFKGDYTLSGIKGISILDTTFTELFPDFSSPDQSFLLEGATLRLRVRYNII